MVDMYFGKLYPNNMIKSMLPLISVRVCDIWETGITDSLGLTIHKKCTFPCDLSDYPWHCLLWVPGVAFWVYKVEVNAGTWCIFNSSNLEIYFVAETATDAKMICICSSCSQSFCWFPQWTVNLRSVLLTLCWMCFSRIPAWKERKYF